MTQIYHITHIRNLNNILVSGGLVCDTNIIRDEIQITNIGYNHIKKRRRDTEIPCCKNITIGECVPFYFTNRSPMLYAINKGLVQGYSDGQKPIIYFTACVEKIIEDATLLWWFTDGHAIEAVTRYFQDWQYCNCIDWNIINSRIWHNTDNDPDKKRRKQAEFLIHNFLKWDYIESITVINADMKLRVEETLNAHPQIKRTVFIQPSWYY
ncbi:MAG: DUF4433 domain-containing protein [Planctomycetaceae bacterium]|jgi:hypothetical protein|nr:DUF4433 domain-containing protein [Planctomycetaceae bacterium]